MLAALRVATTIIPDLCSSQPGLQALSSYLQGKGRLMAAPRDQDKSLPLPHPSFQGKFFCERFLFLSVFETCRTYCGEGGKGMAGSGDDPQVRGEWPKALFLQVALPGK